MFRRRSGCTGTTRPGGATACWCGQSSSARSTTCCVPSSSSKGADLPLLLIFAGVIGGLIAFGVIGLFVGPVVLAVTYTLLTQWLEEREYS